MSLAHPQTEDATTMLAPSVGNGTSDADSRDKLLSLINDTDQFLREVHVPKVSNLTFEVGGIPFHARHVPHGPTAQLLIWGTLGYLPYTVQSKDKRNALIGILEGARALPHVKIGVGPEMRIIVTGEYKIANPPTPDYLFVPLIKFIQESRGFIKLIGETL